MRGVEGKRRRRDSKRNERGVGVDADKHSQTTKRPRRLLPSPCVAEPVASLHARQPHASTAPTMRTAVPARRGALSSQRAVRRSPAPPRAEGEQVRVRARQATLDGKSAERERADLPPPPPPARQSTPPPPSTPPTTCAACGIALADAPRGCDGAGRVAGGVGAVLSFWPVKAYRPCPALEKAGLAYTRKGQITDEMLFGSKGQK